MRLHYPTMPLSELVLLLNRPADRIGKQARRLMLSKTPEAIRRNSASKLNQYPPEIRELTRLRNQLLKAIGDK